MTMYKGIFNGARWITRRYIFIFGSLGGYIYTVKQWGGELPVWVANYMNDFLCMPIVLFICRSVVRKLRSNGALQLPFPLTLLLTMYFVVYFEYYLPQVNVRYTADIWDVVLYFSGSVFFYMMEKRLSVLEVYDNEIRCRL